MNPGDAIEDMNDLFNILLKRTKVWDAEYSALDRGDFRDDDRGRAFKCKNSIRRTLSDIASPANYLDEIRKRLVRRSIEEIYHSENGFIKIYAVDSGKKDLAARMVAELDEDKIKGRMATAYALAGGNIDRFLDGTFAEPNVTIDTGVSPPHIPHSRPPYKMPEAAQTSGMGRRPILKWGAAAVGVGLGLTGVGLNEFDNRTDPPDFPLGDEALHILLKEPSGLDKKVLKKVGDISIAAPGAPRITMIKEIDASPYPAYKAQIIGALFINALNTGNLDLATDIVQHASILKEIRFQYTKINVRREDKKDFIELATEGYKADFDSDYTDPNTNEPIFKKGQYAIIPRESWLDMLKGKPNDQTPTTPSRPNPRRDDGKSSEKPVRA
jgi:hypothetical protein